MAESWILIRKQRWLNMIKIFRYWIILEICISKLSLMSMMRVSRILKISTSRRVYWNCGRYEKSTNAQAMQEQMNDEYNNSNDRHIPLNRWYKFQIFRFKSLRFPLFPMPLRSRDPSQLFHSLCHLIKPHQSTLLIIQTPPTLFLIRDDNNNNKLNNLKNSFRRYSGSMTL